MMLLAMSLTLGLSAQGAKGASKKKAEITFAEDTWDFGSVREELGSVTHIFNFTNTGDTTIALTNVRASCGCTTPKWNKEPIQPGESGSIEVRYSTSGRPGAFTKSITVNSNAGRQQLLIKGQVIPRGQKVENAYPVLMGDVRVKSKTVNFGNVEKGKKKTLNFPIANATDREITVTFTELPKYVTAAPVVLKAKEWGNVAFEYDGAKTNEWGTDDFDIDFITQKGMEEQELDGIATVIEVFTNEQKASAPLIELPTAFEMGTITAGTKVTKSFVVRNNGKSDLLIREVEDPDGIDVKMPKKIKAGGQGNVKVTIDTRELKSTSLKSQPVMVINNDPYHSRKSLNVNYTVK